MMAVIAYVHLLNARPEPGADNFATERRIGLAEIGSMPISAESTRADALHLDFM